MKFPGYIRQRTPQLTVCIPAYRAGGFLERTVASVHEQCHRDWTILIANDGAHDRDKIDSLKRFGNTKVYHNQIQRGWVRNSNWLIDRAKSPYFAILPHDDEILPDYYTSLIEMLENRPEASSAFSDIQTKGLPKDIVIDSEEILGSDEDRVFGVLTKSWAGVSYRAVNRRVDRGGDLRIPGNRFNDAYADSTWIMKQALQGEMLRIDRPLYIKNLHETNTHAGWTKMSSIWIASAWSRYCMQLGWIASRREDCDVYHEKLIELCSQRMFARDNYLRPQNVQEAFEKTWSEQQQKDQALRFQSMLRRAIKIQMVSRIRNNSLRFNSCRQVLFSLLKNQSLNHRS
jgi:glycosyltransferase involved in cell wall biosynthesis